MAYTLYKDITTVNRTIMTNKTNKYIVIHYTGNKTDTAKNNATYFKSVNRNASAHYFVDKTSVYQVVDDKDAAWSIGKNYGSNNLFNIVKNNNSINIEMCSDNGTIANETFNNTVALTKTLMKKYNIPVSNVYRHFDICSKNCPGYNGWIGSNVSLWNKFKDEIASTVAPSTTSSSSVVSDLYRVRKTWTDTSSQIGAYSVLENAKAACKEGYYVFDSNGNIVYPKSNSSASICSSGTEKNFLVKINVNALHVRKGAGTNFDIVTIVKKGEIYTIISTIKVGKSNWGLLKSKIGYICLDYVQYI